MSTEAVGIDRKANWEWLAFAASLPGNPNQFVGISASEKLISGRWIVQHVSVSNTATTAATLTLYDGQDATGEIICVIDIPANTTQNVSIGSNGAFTQIGVFLGVVTGTLTGSVVAVPMWVYENTLPGT